MLDPGVFDRLRQPQYTGENRCVPCTVANVAIAAVVSVGIGAAVVVPIGPATASVVAVVALAVFAVVIYLRGYLVPGTPRLTKTYVPDWLLRRFERGHRDERSVGAGDTDEGTVDAPVGEAATGEVDVEAFLLEVGAVTDCDDEEDLCLTDEFRTAWRDQIDRLRDADATRADTATILDVDPDRLSFEEYEEAFLARLDGRRVGRWESHAAFLADMAATRVLRERHGRWASLDVQSRGQILSGLRLFLERCPSCDGPVTVDQSVVESCCRSIDVLAVTCQDCGARVFEIERA